MSRPLFVIGPQRAGTTITARLLTLSPRIGPDHLGYCPYDRWDIAALAEIGGQIAEQPLMAGFESMLRSRTAPDDWTLAKLALPASVEGLGWVRLVDRFSDACFVLVHRDAHDTYDSWSKLAYLAGGGPLWPKSVHGAFLEQVGETQRDVAAALPGRCVFVSFESLVTDADSVFGPVWQMLDVPPVAGLGAYMKPPVHGRALERHAGSIG